MLNTIQREEFDLLSAFYYDDKFAFEIDSTIDSSLCCAIIFHELLGIVFNFEKIHLEKSPVVLGIKYDLDRSVLAVTNDRRAGLIREILDIFVRSRLGSGLAGKIRGKLGFAASVFWGKIGRAFFRSLTERQYDKSGRTDLTRAIKLSLMQWIKILVGGTPREIALPNDHSAEVTIFTDGFYPNASRDEVGDPRVGGVIFDQCRSAPMTFTQVLPWELIEEWLPRSNQIAMVELFAPILAVMILGEELRGRSVVIFIDNESVESALIKGYSSREDLCELTAVFWDQCESLKIECYIDRVSTDANIADGPSRDYQTFWDLADRLGWHRIHSSIPECLHRHRSSRGLGVTN